MADAPPRRERPKKDTRAAEARQAMAKLMRQLFDLPAVLRGTKPVGSLSAGPELLGMVVGMLSQSLVLDVITEFNRRLAKTIYMRDMQRFNRQIVGLAAISMLYSLLSSCTSALYLRLVVKWRERLTNVVQKQYINSLAFYRLQNDEQFGVDDPDTRLSNDISSVSSTLASLLYSTSSTVINSVSAVIRLAVFLSPQHVLVCGGYLLFVFHYRERIVPAIQLGMMSGEISGITGEYQKAHLRLQEHSEAILTAGGASVEKASIERSFDRYIVKMKAYQALSRKVCPASLSLSSLSSLIFNNHQRE